MEGTVALKCDWCGGCLYVETGTLLPSSIKSLGFWVYMRQTASTHSINIWEKEKVCLVWGRLRFLFLWFRRCPQFPVSVCQSGGRTESTAAASAAAWLSERLMYFHGNQTQSSQLSQNASVLWNMVTGTFTGQQQASFSTSCLSMTCSNIKWLFHSNCLGYYSY